MSRPLAPATGLLHPLPLLAVVLLVVNDHWLKGALPGWWTGKLSDVAGMLFFPLLLQAGVEWGLAALGRPWGPDRRVLCVAAVATALVFSAVQLWPPATELYRWGLGVVQFPVRALAGARAIVPVQVSPDPTDLLAVPFVFGAILAGWDRRVPRG